MCSSFFLSFCEDSVLALNCMPQVVNFVSHVTMPTCAYSHLCTCTCMGIRYAHSPLATAAAAAGCVCFTFPFPFESNWDIFTTS